jgi:hypothetical protein
MAIQTADELAGFINKPIEDLVKQRHDIEKPD